MNISDNLYKLVKSLNKNEKIYFKKYAARHIKGRRNKYTALFDAISKAKDGIDDKQLKQIFRGEKFIKNFPVMKKYLFGILMKSLNSFYGDSGTESEVKSKVRYIEILYKKGLFSGSVKILKSAIKQAYETDNFPVILELIRWKKNLVYEGVYKGNEFVNLENAHKEELDIINKLKNLSEYRHLFYRTASLAKKTNPYITGNEVIRELQRIKRDPLLQNENMALSYPAVIAYYHVLALIHESLSDNQGATEFRMKLVSVFENYPEKQKENLSNYIITVFNLLGSFLLLKKYDELKYCINKLKDVGSTYKGKISENDRLLIFMGTSIFGLRMNTDKGDFSKSNREIKEIENGLVEFSNKIVRNDVLHCCYLIGYAYFGAGKIEHALLWVNKILNAKEDNIDSRLSVKSRILNMVIHYELGNFELLDSLIQSTYRFLKKSGFRQKDEKNILELLKRLPKINSQSQVPELFVESLYRLRLESLDKTAGNYNNGNAIRVEIQNIFTDSADFDLESWLESKVLSKSFEETVKQKTANDNISALTGKLQL